MKPGFNWPLYKILRFLFKFSSTGPWFSHGRLNWISTLSCLWRLVYIHPSEEAQLISLQYGWVTSSVFKDCLWPGAKLKRDSWKVATVSTNHSRYQLHMHPRVEESLKMGNPVMELINQHNNPLGSEWSNYKSSSSLDLSDLIINPVAFTPTS